jgi:hypothetical protein
MSQPEPEPDTAEDTTEEDHPNVELTDPDDYHRKQRLKEIHKRRQQVNKILDDIDRWNKSDEHSRQKLALADGVTAYIGELEPMIMHTEEEPRLPDAMPWESVHEYADLMGSTPKNEDTDSHYVHHFRVFRACNRYLARVKPLIEEDDENEWEV